MDSGITWSWDLKLFENQSRIVDQILTAQKEDPEADTSDLEAEIDRLAYELYGLSEEEIEIVMDSSK